MSDQVSRKSSDQSSNNENQAGTTDSATKILSEQYKVNQLTGETQKLQVAAATDAMVGPILPNVTITGGDTTSPLIKPDPKYMSDEDGSFGHFVGDALNVANIVREGAWKEATEHPVDLLITGAEGVAIGAAALLLAPEVVTAAAVAGIGYGAWQLVSHMGGWMHDADVVTSPEDYTDKEVANAHQDLEGVGAGGAHLLAGTLGGLAAKPLVVAGEGLIGALTSEAGVAVDSATGATVESAAATLGDGSAESIAKSQDIFRAAKDSGTLENLAGRPPQYTLEKAGPGGISFKTVLGERAAPEGEWVLTEMSPDGITPGTKYVLNDDDIMQSFKTSPEQLATSNEFIGLQQKNFAPQHMVELPDGKWLVNSDYNAATGEPGQYFHTISKAIYDETYKPISDYSSYIPDPNKPVLWVAESTANSAEGAAVDATTASATEIAAGEGAVEASAEAIARDQAIFRAAQNDNAVESVTKYPAQYSLEKVGPGGVPSTNPIEPEGTMVPEGDWLLKKYSPDGTKVVSTTEMPNDFVMEAYGVTPEQLAENGKFVISHNPKSVPTQMVKLPDGNWLVNSDYNVATGEPGNGFYKISNDVYDTWYNPLTEHAPFVPDPSVPVLSGD